MLVTVRGPIDLTEMDFHVAGHPPAIDLKVRPEKIRSAQQIPLPRIE